MGDKVRIKVVAANLTKRQLDYEWVLATKENSPEETAMGKPKRKKKKAED
jgi:ribonuclease R